MARRPKAEVKTGEWLNTYADMVTLILCFFVLLFSMSSVNADKWKVLVNSLNPNAVEVNVPILIPGDNKGDDPPAGETVEQEIEDINFEELFQSIAEYIEENSLSDSIEAKKVDGIIFLQFRQDVLFDGDSYILRESGRTVLDALAGALTGLNDLIGEVRILGHTNRVTDGVPNLIAADRHLAANRAVTVLVYLAQKGIIDGRKLVDMGYGEFWPVAPHNTEDDAQKNRRVEIIIMQNDKVNQALENVYASLGIALDQST